VNNIELKRRNFILGTMTVFSLLASSLAPMLIMIQNDYNIKPSVAGLLPLFNAFGGMVANFFGSMIIAQFGLLNSLYVSVFFGVTGSVLFFFSDNFILLMISLFIIGMATGSSFMGMTSAFAHVDEKYQNYGFLHAFYGLGGILAPLFVTFFRDTSLGYKGAYIIYSAFLLIVFFFMFFTKIIENKIYEKIKIKEGFKIIFRNYIFVALIIFMIYSGIENGIVTWGGNLFTERLNYTGDFYAATLSKFWIVFTLGRVFSELFLKFLGNKKMLYMLSFGAVISLIALLEFEFPFLFIITGLFLSGFFPVLQKYINQKLSKREVGLFSGILYFSTNLGNMIIMYTMGLFGDISFIYSYIMLIILFIFIIFMLRRLFRIL